MPPECYDTVILDCLQTLQSSPRLFSDSSFWNLPLTFPYIADPLIATWIFTHSKHQIPTYTLPEHVTLVLHTL